ncbi:hypothetical protein D917_02084 [Trichinella nativa]|uniref:Uncharacterized protein n=1 Tax=Trichinella nativa TaxID=6335 RepID=A0A1Y3EPH9_9BILA|nr:hypothetical protein D917_02084 [Trichinella nativa]
MVIFTNKKKAPLFDKQVTLDLKKELQRLEKAFVRVISKQQVEEGAIEHSLWPTLTILGLTIAADDRPVWRRKANLKQNVNYIHTVLTN